MRRRAALAADPRWAEYLRIAAGLVVQQESKRLLPAAFTPAHAPIQP
jgi:hypothetical protein